MSKSKLRGIFAGNVKSLRKRRGLSQEVLGKKSRLSTRFVAMIEKGTENPSLDVIEALAIALGVTVPEIMEAAAAAPSKGKLIRATIKALEEIEATVDSRQS